MQIQVLSVIQTTEKSAAGKPYQMLEVAYKNLTFQGKVESKKLMPFGANKAAFDVLALAKPSEIFDIDVVKNDRGYNDWIKVTKGSAATGGAENAHAKPTNAQSSTPTKGGWETPEERAKKQVYIIRQSSLTNAVATLSVGRKGEIKKEEVIELAKYYEDFVFGNNATASTATLEVGRIEDMEEDPLPF